MEDLRHVEHPVGVADQGVVREVLSEADFRHGEDQEAVAVSVEGPQEEEVGALEARGEEVEVIDLYRMADAYWSWVHAAFRNTRYDEGKREGNGGILPDQHR